MNVLFRQLVGHKHLPAFVSGLVLGIFLFSLIFFASFSHEHHQRSSLDVLSCSPSHPGRSLHMQSNQRQPSTSSQLDATDDTRGFLDHELEFLSTNPLLSCLNSFAPKNSLIVSTRSIPPFPMCVLDPRTQAYNSSSAELFRYGLTSAHLIQVLSPLLHRECTERNHGLVVFTRSDVGFLPLLAASAGCHVLALESRKDLWQAILTSLCANPEAASRFRLHEWALDSRSVDVNPRMLVLRAYEGSDEDVGHYDEHNARDHLDCTLERNAGYCRDVQSISLGHLLDPGSSHFDFARHLDSVDLERIFLLQLNGDPDSIHALLKNRHNVLAYGRVQHILLSFRPHLIGRSLARQLLLSLDEMNYEVSEIPHQDSEFAYYELFQHLRSTIASPYSTMAKHSFNFKYVDLETASHRIFDCKDLRQRCRSHLLFSLTTSHTTYASKIVPHNL